MASRSLNKVLLIGNLTRDPELRYTPQGTAVCQFGLATNRDWMTANGEKKEEVQFHRVIAWSKLAELCSQLLSKGSKVFVDGRIVYRSFQGKDGEQKNITEIVMDNMIVLSSRGISAKTTAFAQVEDEVAEETVEETKSKKEPKKESKKEKKPNSDKEDKKLVEEKKEKEEETEAEDISDDEIPF